MSNDATPQLRGIANDGAQHHNAQLQVTSIRDRNDSKADKLSALLNHPHLLYPQRMHFRQFSAL